VNSREALIPGFEQRNTLPNGAMRTRCIHRTPASNSIAPDHPSCTRKRPDHAAYTDVDSRPQAGAEGTTGSRIHGGGGGPILFPGLTTLCQIDGGSHQHPMAVRAGLIGSKEVRAEQQRDPRARISAVNPDRFARA
jgi:hypothetical protein